MADAQLNRVLAANDQLKDELKYSETIVNVSESCKELQDFCNSTKDPFFPDYDGENPFIVSNDKGNGFCELL
eukprot:CAMPEP_0119134418 /NCGR_PEP_ID=MMETSP1310-20130426/16828_1 /TAXON_ID=464262 /ORGANISM="Genus nov. species nov., Strain RCC2339" /LENGTH=71 /DNA_ID=CAMNT_0007125209 /DNA_START=79 /DNA_END=294 /DNA_ORIENTATION=-